MKRFHKITASCLLIAVVVGFSAFLYAVEISENDTVHAGRHNNQKKLVRDENGRIYLVYSHYDESEAQWKIYYTESDDGTTWNEPVSPWSDAYYYPSIAIDSSGNIHLVMVKSAGIYYSKKTSSWSSPEKVNTSGSSWTAPSIAVDSNKKPHIAWSQDSGGAEIFYSSRTSSGWCVPVNVSASSPTGSLQPQVLIDVENKIYIVWRDSASVRFSYYDTGWEAPFTVSTFVYTAGSPSAVLDSDNHIHLFWANSDGIYYSKYMTEWSTQVLIYPSGGASLYYPSSGIDENDNLYLAWCEDSTKKIYYAKYKTEWSSSCVISDEDYECNFPNMAGVVTDAGCDVIWTQGDKTPYSVIYENIDILPPYLYQNFPVNGATNVDVGSNITIYLKDADEGVSLDLVTITVKGNTVYDDGGTEQTTAWGVCSVEGDGALYKFTYNPSSDFGYNDTVNVVVKAGDLAPVPNMMQARSFSFKTVSGYIKLTNNLFDPTEGGKVDIEYGFWTEDGAVKMTLYTLGKELVKTFDEGTKTATTVHLQSWAGLNDSGNIVSSGIYIVHIEAPGFKDTKKIAIVK